MPKWFAAALGRVAKTLFKDLLLGFHKSMPTIDLQIRMQF